MDIAPSDTRPIEGEHLTDWAVLAGGTHLRLDFTGTDGKPNRIVLPFDVLFCLLMTLPRMLQSALNARFSDGSLRFVQLLGNWRIEQAEASAGLILRLGTPDGFEVTFAVDGNDANALGAALIAAPDTIQSRMRRPH
jgi:hypothetical protein